MIDKIKNFFRSLFNTRIKKKYSVDLSLYGKEISEGDACSLSLSGSSDSSLWRSLALIGIIAVAISAICAVCAAIRHA